MGARFIAAGFLLGSVYYARALLAGKITVGSFAWRVLLITFLAGGAGKFIGIVYHRLKHKRLPSSRTVF